MQQLKVVLPMDPQVSILPKWAGRLEFPEFEHTESRLTPDGGVMGRKILLCELDVLEESYLHRYGYEFLEDLKKKEMVASTLDLKEGYILIDSGEVQANPQFRGRTICLWRSTIRDRVSDRLSGSEGNAFVPVIQNIAGQKPVIYWWYLGYRLTESKYTPFFSK